MDHQTNRNVQIGNVCVQWASLEYRLAVAIWIMVGVDMEIGKVLTASLDMKQRATMAFTLAHQTNAPIPFKNALKSVLTALREGLIDRRNQAVHGIHFTIDRPDAIGVEMHRGKGGRQQRIQEDKELSQLGRDINRAANEFAAALPAYVEFRFKGLAEISQGLADLKAIILNNAETKDEGDVNGPE
jgi:hypothetical protein